MKSGIHFDIDPAAYHRDPCPEPSLTQSVAKILIDQSPLHAWHAHPRLNPDWRADDDTKFDVGNIAHKILLGRGKEIVVLNDFDDWRTKAAKELREAAAAEGKLAVLGKHAAKADRMVNAARAQLDLRGLDGLFGADGNSEIVLAWQEGNIWLRQMVDWLSDDRRVFADYKTTDMSAAPHALGRMMVNAGWPIQAAFAERGLDVLDPATAGRRQYLFVAQEAEPPYALSVAAMSKDALAMGAKQVEFAATAWKTCFARDRWPGYPQEIVTPEYPGWHEQQWLDREIHEAARARVPLADDHMMAG